jgi:uncharacterized protein
MEPVFHLSLSVSDLAQTRRFYEQVLDARVGRVTDHWLDLWIFGTQLTAYARPAGVVPSPYREAQHFGATLGWNEWRAFADRLVEAEVAFRLPPTLDAANGTAKMMLADPDGYLIEIKAYADPTTLHRPVK